MGEVSLAKLAVVLFCVGAVIGYANGQCTATQWNWEDKQCDEGLEEIYKDVSDGATQRLCCDPKHEAFKSYKYLGVECRTTDCATSTSGDLCRSLNDRYVDGAKLDYEEIMREPCKTKAGSTGVSGLCCRKNPTESALAAAAGAEPHEFPHMAKLKLPGHCGGTIYNKRWIITASHCIVDGKSGKPNDVKEMTAILGSNMGDIEGKDHVYQVKRVVPHPQYSRLKGQPEFKKKDKRIFNDIALIELDREITFGPYVKALEIAPKDFEAIKFPYKTVIVGWGTTDTLEVSKHLQKTNFILRRDTSCFGNEAIPWPFMAGMEDQLLCVGGVMEGKWSSTAGGGDSGGPAICRGPDGKALLCGVTSFGGDDEKCAANQDEKSCPPSVYAEVAHFHDWIVENAGEQDPDTLYKPYLYGEPVPKGNYPHQVHITSQDGKPCGGTLLAPDVVVTAAQCVMTAEKKSRKGIKVTSGINDVKEEGTTHGIKGMTALPGFKRVGDPLQTTGRKDKVLITDLFYNHDLAILKLDSAANISPEQIPGLPESRPEFGTELAFPRETDQCTQMLSRQFKFLTLGECQTRMNKLSRYGRDIKVGKSVLCGVEKYSGGSDCDRELGGGVICKGPEGKDVLCGVQVFRMCQFSLPNGFMDMVIYKDWVKQAMAQLQ